MKEKNNGCYIVGALLLMCALIFIFGVVGIIENPVENGLSIAFLVILLIWGIVAWLVRNNNK